MVRKERDGRQSNKKKERKWKGREWKEKKDREWKGVNGKYLFLLPPDARLPAPLPIPFPVADEEEEEEEEELDPEPRLIPQLWRRTRGE